MKKLVKMMIFLAVLCGIVQWRANAEGVTPQTWVNRQVVTLRLVINQAQSNLSYLLGKENTEQSTTSTTTNSTTASSSSSSTQATWGKRSVKVYLSPKMSSHYRKVWLAAIKAWNNTKAFKFIVVTKKSQAKVTLSTESTATTSDAGVTDKSWLVYANKSILTKASAKLNRYYLDRYSYQRQLNTAEHELGHVIGLSHDNKHRSVMQSSGSYYSIQKRDVANVNKLYVNLK